MRRGAEARSRHFHLSAKESFYAGDVRFGVDAHGVEVDGLDVEGDAVFEQAELFEALGLFERGRLECAEAKQGRSAIGV